MKKITKLLFALVLAGAFTGPATAGDDDITSPIITNIFTNVVTQSSSSLRAARVGVNSTTGRAALILNQENYAPVVLSNTNGVLTYNGVVLSTDTISGTDIAVSGDLTVGDDAAISGLLTVAETLAVAGASSLVGNVTAGAANFKSTMTAASGAWAITGAVTSLAGLSGTSGTLSTTLSVAGAAAILGAVELGAENTQSTVTAAGAAAFHASVAAPAFTGATLALTGASAILGANEWGAENTQSTMTAAGALTVFASVTSPLISSGATGAMRCGTRTIAQLLAATAVMGEFGICSDCTPVEVFISTGAGAPATGGYGNAAGLQLD